MNMEFCLGIKYHITMGKEFAKIIFGVILQRRKLLIFKKEILVKNPFDEELAGKEDRYWANNWIAKKNKILYQPAFEVNHFYTSEGHTWKGIG